MKCGQFKYIKEITRIKNRFTSIPNLLVETANAVMICECQFIIDWMLKVKKLSHTYYELLRNEEMFEQMYIIMKESSIITQDFNALYQLLVYNQFIYKLNDQTQKQLI